MNSSTIKEFSGRSFANLKSIAVSMLSTEEIKKISTIKICTPLVLNALGHPLPGGLHDPAMGPLHEDSSPCSTCGLNSFSCPGHMGYIELPLPVVNPLFYKPIGNLLRNTCFTCHRLQLAPQFKYLVIGQLQLLNEGFLTSAKNAELIFTNIDPADFYNQEVDETMRNMMDEYVASEKKKMKGAGKSDVTLVEAMRNEIVTAALKEYSTRKKCIYCKKALVKMTVYKTRMIISRKLSPVSDDADTSIIKMDEGSMVQAQEKKSVNHKKGTSKRKIVVQAETLSPDASRTLMRFLWGTEKVYLQLLFPVLNHPTLKYPTDLLFLEVVSVTPSNSRPPNKLNGMIMEHPQTSSYKKVVQDALILRNVMVVVQEGNTDMLPPEGKMLYQSVQGKTPTDKLHFAWETLQNSVDALMDNDLHPGYKLIGEGLKQVIEKKEGLIRMHVMGKRVNFASRSVITPDPNLNIDEVGLPEAFAKKLTFPVPVTPWNVNELKTLVLNGPAVHPGACMIENNDGSVTKIPEHDRKQRKALANMLLMPDERLSKFSKGVKRVHRHLVNGDILLMNRQPTLHRPSIMAHKARILKGEKTLRMHYSNCKSYNADFDGDEMNAHCPQSELGRSEAYNLVDVCNQYLVPKDGTPLGGLIQDHMVSGVRLSMRGRFFTREDYMQLVYQAVAHINGDIRLLPPTIIKPVTLWSGKQVISTVMINIIPRDRPKINLTASAKIGENAWIRGKARKLKAGGTPLKPNIMSEAEVVIRQGELLCGVLDKTHYGATAYGLVHCVFELYGGKCATSLLTALGKLFMAFLQFIEGFTLGVEDILVLDSADRTRADIIQECRKIGKTAAAAALGVPPETPNLPDRLFEAYNDLKSNFRGEIDRQFKTILNTYTDRINKTCLPEGLLQKFPSNNLQLMVMSGAKGSTVNTMQISCLLGQIELEGRRPPLMVSGRSLPSFAPYDCQPRAGGFVDGRFLTGIQPQEFFFHCMAGREGLIDTAVKTSRSGYLQRCLVKHLEGLSVNYDTTVRDSDGSVIQFAYGEDGMDVTKMPFLKPQHMDFLYENRHVINNSENITALKNATDTDTIKEEKKRLKKWTKGFSHTSRFRTTPFLEFTKSMADQLNTREWKMNPKTGRSDRSKVLMLAWRKVKSEVPLTFRRPDPVTSAFPPSIHYTAIPERLESMLEDYLKHGKGQHLSSKDKKEFRDIVYYKVLSASCHPGEPVGILAAQSVGEPSTQMTLNTFHFAGRGEMNVTLGIPRLKEILMTASKNISTPSMEIPFKDGVTMKTAEKLRAKLTKLTLADVFEYVKVTESLALQPQRMNVYTLEMHFLPRELYKDEFSTTPKRILQHVEQKFIAELLVEIRRLTKIKVDIMSEEKRTGCTEENNDDPESECTENPKPMRKKGTGEHHVSSDEEDEGDDEDATATRLRQKRRDGDHDEDQSEEDQSDDEESLEGSPKDPDDESEYSEEVIKPVDPALVKKRQEYVLNRYSNIQNYTYDTKSEEWCIIEIGLPVGIRKMNLSSMLKTLADKSVISHVSGINRAFIVDKKMGLILKTDGLNMTEMVKHEDILDINRIYSNDIHAFAAMYGIEAAGRVIVREIQEVFKVYGIEVDARHLTLISDYLTSDGSFRGMNRRGLENNPSFLQKMSFESSLQFLKTAVWGGKKEFLQSPSSRIFVGYPCKSGTGSFEVLQKLSVGAN